MSREKDIEEIKKVEKEFSDDPSLQQVHLYAMHSIESNWL
jgi:hypothetical protein